MNQTGYTKSFLHLGILLAFSVVAMIPMMIDGIPGGMDIPQQYQFAQSYAKSVQEGVLFPFWADQPNFGYGDISVRFYPPLAYYVLYVFQLLSGNWFDATILFVISMFFVCAVGMYSWASEWFPKNSALFAGIVSIFLPYHMMQIYIGTLFAEFTAAAVLPFCFLFVTRVCRNGKWHDLLGLTISLSLLTLSHLPTTLMASVVLLLYSIFSIQRGVFLNTIARLAAAVGLSMATTAFYWVRMITELEWLQHNTERFSTGFYSYDTQFVLSYLFPFTNAAWSEPNALMNMIAVLTLAATLIFGVAFYRKRNEMDSPPHLMMFSLAGFTLAMSTPLTILIWRAVTPLQKIQFPFRWLTLFSLFCCLILAAGFKPVTDYFKTSRRYLTLIAFGVLLVFIPFNYSRMMNPLSTYPRDYLNSVVKQFAIGSSYECWWPIWTQSAPPDPNLGSTPRTVYLPDRVVLNDRPFSVESWAQAERRFVIEAGKEGSARVATVFYPHWKAYVNDVPTPVTGGDNGLITFNVPAERSTVLLRFEEPNAVLYSYRISQLFGLVLVLFALFLTTTGLIARFSQKLPN